MPLPAGTTLSHYELLGSLGAGAMGEVYRARDTRLGREVAIKVLPTHFAEEPERLARFEREARSLASLNHPNIAQIHGVDEASGFYFLALELVPGETLEERLARGPLPPDEALDVCRQIAEGLEAAHEAGVIHRDLKPANIRITPEGKVKLLDFGLAKPSPGSSGSQSSTDSVLSTEAGRLLGTPTYMAPEQARGKSIDRRVDIWAFGCVLYECLTARRAYAGETLSDVLGAVLHTEPDLTRLPPDTPPRVRELVADCLVKDPRGRARDAGEIRRQLEHAHRAPGPPARAASGPRRERAAWLVAALAVLAVLYLALRPVPAPPAAAVVRSSLLLPRDFLFARIDRPLSLSPDGRRLVVAGAQAGEKPLLWIRALDSTVLQPLLGSEDASYPFWSPDGRDLAFFADGKLKRMPASGGPVTTLCASESSRGGSWGARGDIVFTPTPFGPLYRVPATGGTPTPITSVSGRESHRLPHFLPDGRHLLYTRTSVEPSGIHVLDLDTGESRALLDVDSDARYAAPGWLLFVRGRSLMAQAFDLERLALSGEARVVVETVSFNPYRSTGAYSVSRSGEVVYDPPLTLRQLQWFDAGGRPGERLGTPARFEEISLSPDETRIAALIGREGDERDLWILDTQRGLGTKLVDQVARGGVRAWFPDRDTIVYSRREPPPTEEFVAVLQALDGGSAPREFRGGWASDLSPDGQWMLFARQRPVTNFDIEYRRLDGNGELFELAASVANELGARFSPDGRWIVFASDESGRRDLYLQPFPGPGSRLQLTAGGQQGVEAWLPDGRLVYRSSEDTRKLLALRVDTSGARPAIGEPEPFGDGLAIADAPFAINADGSRLLVAVPAEGRQSGVVNLIQNGLAPAAAGQR